MLHWADDHVPPILRFARGTEFSPTAMYVGCGNTVSMIPEQAFVANAPLLGKVKRLLASKLLSPPQPFPGFTRQGVQWPLGHWGKRAWTPIPLKKRTEDTFGYTPLKRTPPHPPPPQTHPLGKRLKSNKPSLEVCLGAGVVRRYHFLLCTWCVCVCVPSSVCVCVWCVFGGGPNGNKPRARRPSQPR